MKTAFKQKDGSVKWVNYQDLPGIKGERKIEGRIKYFNPLDFKGKKVLDVGCWGGQMILQAKKWGAEARGVEIDLDAVRLGRKLGLDIMRDNIENPFFWREIPRYDTILLLAILGNMRNKEAVLSIASQKADVIYVEGHGKQHKFTRADYMDLFLIYTDFKTIEYLGDIQTRPFFRLAREERSIDYILKKNYNRIALTGKSGAGKTYFLKYFKGYKIYSDTKKVGNEKRFVVDNHGALTLADYDCVINLVSSKRKERVIKRAGRFIDLIDVASSQYKKGAYDFFTITND